MTNEIKEILDNIKRQNEWEGIEYFKTPLSTEQANKLLDYITNLQEENIKLKELCDKYEEEHSTAFKIWTMKMKEMPDYEERMNYKSRNEKAIEYLEKSKLNQLNTCCKYLHVDYDTGKIENIDNLLNILKGDNK